jgi:hypothetical protein
VLTHLRIHIHISIAFAPAPVSVARTPQSALVPAQPPAPVLRTATQTATPSAPSQLHPENPQAWGPIDDVEGDGLAKPEGTRDRQFALFLGRRWRSSRAAYLRWADSFVFDRPQAQPAYSLPRFGRNLFHFIFPR